MKLTRTTEAPAGKSHPNAPAYPEKRHPSVLKSVRLHCLDCNGGSIKATNLCPMPHCRLFPFRFGQMPNTARAKGKLVDPELFTHDDWAGGEDASD